MNYLNFQQEFYNRIIKRTIYGKENEKINKDRGKINVL